jgi:hypothetical protein
LRMLTNSIQKDMGALDYFKAQGITITYLEPSIQKELYGTALKLMEEKAAKDAFIAKGLGVSKAVQGELQQVQSHDDAPV